MKDEIRQILREGMMREERIKFNIDIPQDIQKIQSVFHKNGFKLYVVGGAVRDAILGKQPKDFDLATDAVPDEVERIMAEAGLRTLPTGKAFGVINVFTDKGEYEIATFRTDIGAGRRPDGVSFTNIEGDVKRRDLTVNALFYDIDTHEVVDLVGGMNDIKNGVVRTVGAPEDRFGEDRLRIMRAIRFAGRFGSELDPATDAALKKDAKLFGFPITKDAGGTSSNNISGERIHDEFMKGIASAKSVKHFLQLIAKYGLFDYVFHGLKTTNDFIEDNDPIIVIASILKNNTVELLRKKLNELKYSVEEVKAIAFLIATLKLNVETAVALKKAQEHAGVTPEQIKKFSSKEGVDAKLLSAFLKFRLSVSGPEVMDKLKLKPGPEVGKAIHSMETDNFKKLL